MDKLNHYIQNGKNLSGKKIILIFASISFLLGILFYILASIIFNKTEIQSVLKEIPTITIKDGIVEAPTTWEKEIPTLGISLTIDNTSDEPKIKRNNALYLGRTKYLMTAQNITHEYQLQDYTGKITANDILNFLKKGMIQTAVFISFLILLFLGLGYYGTYCLSQFLLALFRKNIEKDIIKRASFIGWISVMILNLILMFFSAGFGWLIAIPTATVIAVFCIIQGKPTDTL